jgi:hypothetical protein
MAVPAPGRLAEEGLHLETMQPRKAHVRNGRVVLDEPTNLPDGTEVRVVLVDDDDLDDRERAQLHGAIRASESEIDAGQVVTEEELWTRLRAIR